MGVILCEFESRPPHPDTQEEISKEVSSFFCIVGVIKICRLYPCIAEVEKILLESLGDMEKVRTFVAVVWE